MSSSAGAPVTVPDSTIVASTARHAPWSTTSIGMLGSSSLPRLPVFTEATWSSPRSPRTAKHRPDSDGARRHLLEPAGCGIHVHTLRPATRVTTRNHTVLPGSSRRRTVIPEGR